MQGRVYPVYRFVLRNVPFAAGTGGSADLAVAVLAPGGQLVFRRGDRFAAVSTFAREVGDRAGQLPHRAADRNPEHALPALQQVDDLFRGRALVDGGAVGEQRDVGQVLHAALPEVVHGDPDVLQRDAGVEQSLDDLEDEDVLERVQPLTARACRTAYRGHHQRRARPVVELAVRDARDLAGAGTPVADELVWYRVIGKQAGLNR